MAKSMEHVGIAEMKLSADPNVVLSAPHLGSCVAVAIYDRKNRRGGVIHCLLPFSGKDPEKAQKTPLMYVDTGVSKLIENFLSSGVSKSDVEIYVAGGANINDDNNVFKIGKNNYTVLRKLLWKNNLLIKAEHVGGSISRTLSLHVDTGEVWLKTTEDNVKLN